MTHIGPATLAPGIWLILPSASVNCGFGPSQPAGPVPAGDKAPAAESPAQPLSQSEQPPTPAPNSRLQDFKTLWSDRSLLQAVGIATASLPAPNHATGSAAAHHG